jgi:membrane-associated phospholipid phosphatase
MVNPELRGETNASGVKPLALSSRAARGVVVAAILLWTIAIFLWMQVGLDRWLLIGHTELRTDELVGSIGQLATRYGMSMIVLVYLVYLLFAFKFARLRDAYPIYLSVLLLFGVAGPAGDILKEIVNRPRPFVEYGLETYALHVSGSPSFPSGHATKSVALALPFLLFIMAKDRWHKAVKVLLVVLALGVCYSRVMLGAHYLSDVLAGAGMALICVPLVTLLANKVLARMNEDTLARRVIVWAVLLVGLMVFMAVN